FLVPWRGRAVLGTDYAPREIQVEERVEVLLRDAVQAFPFIRLGREDVTLVHRGFVPGRNARALQTHDVICDHAPAGAAGLLSATAAKYTTARALAEEAVDRVIRALGRAPVACRTATTAVATAADESASLEERVRRSVREEMALGLAD